MADEKQASERWYAVRCILRGAENRPWGPTDLTPGTSAYEERITLWRTPSADEAVAMAEAEATEHAETLGDVYVGFAQAYHLPESPDHGAEVFSLIRYSMLDPDDYLDRFFDSGEERERKVGGDGA
jgi:hypothetical protein